MSKLNGMSQIKVDLMLMYQVPQQHFKEDCTLRLVM